MADPELVRCDPGRDVDRSGIYDLEWLLLWQYPDNVSLPVWREGDHISSVTAVSTDAFLYTGVCGSVLSDVAGASYPLF